MFIAAAAAAAAGRRGRGTGGRGWRWELFVCPARAAAAWEIARVLDRRACMAVVVACGVCTDGRRAPGTQPRPKGGEEKLAFKRRAWKRNEGRGKERKEERLQTSSNVSPGMLGGVRRGEWAPGWAWDGMGCEQRLTNGEFQPQCEFHGRPGQRQLRRIVALEGERGARVGALGCLRRLSLPLSLSLSLRARLGKPPRAKMSWNSDQA